MTHLLKRNQVQNKRHFIKTSLECSHETLNEFSAGEGGHMVFLPGLSSLRPFFSKGKGLIPPFSRMSLQRLFTINRTKWSLEERSLLFSRPIQQKNMIIVSSRTLSLAVISKLYNSMALKVGRKYWRDDSKDRVWAWPEFMDAWQQSGGPPWGALSPHLGKILNHFRPEPFTESHCGPRQSSCSKGILPFSLYLIPVSKAHWLCECGG